MRWQVSWQVGTAEVEATTVAAAWRSAAAIVRADLDLVDEGRTRLDQVEHRRLIWVQVALRSLDPDYQFEDLVEEIMVEPEEPVCASGSGHEWLRLRLHARGLIRRERCSRCGTRRTTTSWSRCGRTEHVVLDYEIPRQLSCVYIEHVGQT